MGVGLQLTNCSQQGVKRSQFYLMFQSEMSYIFNPKHFYYCIKDVQKSKILAKRVIIMQHYRILRILRSSKTFVDLTSHPDYTKHKSYLKCKLYKANQSMKVSLIMRVSLDIFQYLAKNKPSFNQSFNSNFAFFVKQLSITCLRFC